MFEFNNISIEIVENGYIVWAGKSSTEVGQRFVFQELADMYCWMQRYLNWRYDKDPVEAEKITGKCKKK